MVVVMVVVMVAAGFLVVLAVEVEEVVDGATVMVVDENHSE